MIEWPDTIEEFVEKNATWGTSPMLETSLVLDAIEHYFPMRSCSNCFWFHSNEDGRGHCHWNNLCEGKDPDASWGCADWSQRYED